MRKGNTELDRIALMNIIWLNLRKRAGSRTTLASLERLAATFDCDIIFLQETSKKITPVFPILSGMRPVYVSSDLSAFAKNTLEEANVIHSASFALGLSVRGHFIFNVHLSPYKSSDRREELHSLEGIVQSGPNSGIIIGGDFNLAPRPQDGLFNDTASTWTAPLEREAFERLTRVCGLVDLLGQSADQEYSIERLIPGGRVRFRCDLILCSKGLQNVAKVNYLHETRIGAWAVSDHSGMLLSLNDKPSG